MLVIGTLSKAEITFLAKLHQRKVTKNFMNTNFNDYNFLTLGSSFFSITL
jgi:hypothetical protein